MLASSSRLCAFPHVHAAGLHILEIMVPCLVANYHGIEALGLIDSNLVQAETQWLDEAWLCPPLRPLARQYNHHEVSIISTACMLSELFLMHCGLLGLVIANG